MATTKNNKRPDVEKPVRVNVQIEVSLRDRLKLVASSSNMTIGELLDQIVDREIKAWEKLHGFTIAEYMARPKG